MKTTGVQLSARLSVRDLGAIFQTTTQSMYGAKEKLAEFVRRGATRDAMLVSPHTFASGSSAIAQSIHEHRTRQGGEMFEKNEVYYCGKDRRQQQPSQGEKCIMCGRITVSWYTDRETEEDALRKWRHINGA